MGGIVQQRFMCIKVMQKYINVQDLLIHMHLEVLHCSLGIQMFGCVTITLACKMDQLEYHLMLFLLHLHLSRMKTYFNRIKMEVVS